MSSTGLEVFDETVHKTNIWLKEIAQVLGPDGTAPTMRCARYCIASAID
jgi:hypothetical protein